MLLSNIAELEQRGASAVTEARALKRRYIATVVELRRFRDIELATNGVAQRRGSREREKLTVEELDKLLATPLAGGEERVQSPAHGARRLSGARKLSAVDSLEQQLAHMESVANHRVQEGTSASAGPAILDVMTAAQHNPQGEDWSKPGAVRRIWHGARLRAPLARRTAKGQGRPATSAGALSPARAQADDPPSTPIKSKAASKRGDRWWSPIQPFRNSQARNTQASSRWSAESLPS